jgi:hypothetical protein
LHEPAVLKRWWQAIKMPYFAGVFGTIPAIKVGAYLNEQLEKLRKYDIVAAVATAIEKTFK